MDLDVRTGKTQGEVGKALPVSHAAPCDSDESASSSPPQDLFTV